VLLAQIYDQESDTVKEANQLRQFLKTLQDPHAQAIVKQSIAELDKETKK
jgi:Ca2+-binding EF-hand superfamily protein